MANTIPYIFPQFFDDSGNPLTSGYITSKAAGTSSDKDTFGDYEKSSTNPNPIPLASNGRPTYPIFLEDGMYDFKIYNSSNVQVAQQLGVSGSDNGGSVNIPTVETIEELLYLPSGFSDYVKVLGYYSSGDGGGGTFKWTAGITADGGWNFYPVESGGPDGWQRMDEGQQVTPYQFGAKGDGTTNDTNAFQNMLAYSNTVYLGEGRFVVNETLDFTNETNFGDYYGIRITGAGQNATYIYAKNITGPLFQHPNTTTTLTPDRYYFADFTVTGSNSPMGGSLGPGVEANCSTTLTGFIGGANSGSMTLGFIAERVRVTGIATTGAKAWDLSQMFEVTLRNCHTQSIYNGYAYYGNTAGQTSTTIQISDCYVTVVKQCYHFINILDVTFSNQCIFESCDVVGASFWSNITFYDSYLEDVGSSASPLGVSYKALDPLYDASTPSLYYANGVSGARAYVNTAFYDVGGCLTFISGEYTQIGTGLAGLFQGVGLNNGSSSGGKVTFINPRSAIRDRVIFYEQERNSYIYEVQDRHDKTLTGNYCLIKTFLEARKLTKGTVSIRDASSTFLERFEVTNGQFTFGLNPESTYNTFPSVRTDELLPYKTGDRVLLNNAVNIGSGAFYQVYGARSYPTITSVVSAGGTTIPIADVSLIKAGMKCIIDLTGTGSFTASAQTNSGEIAINVASTTGILPGDTVVLTLTPTTGSPYSYTTKVGRIDSATVFSVMYGLPDKIVIGGAISLTAGSHYTEIVSVNTGANTFEITNAIPASRSVAIGANIDFWKWEKSGYGSTVGETLTFTTSPKFTGGLNMLTGDSPLNLENGDAGDLNAPAMKVKANRYVEFLDEDGSLTNSSFLIQNSNDYLAFGHAGQSKIRLEPEGLAIGSGAYSDTPNIISGSGDPATARAQTFTASSSSGLLATYATNLPNYVRVRFTTTGTLPTGLSTGTDYWVVKVSDTTCRFATSYANARAGTVVAYTDAGTGTHTVNRAEKKGTMYIRIDGSSTSTRIYVNTDGALAWTHLTTGA